jgi:hypothetical protein
MRLATELLERLDHEARVAKLDRSKLLRRYLAEGTRSTGQQTEAARNAKSPNVVNLSERAEL